jgi:mannose-6-phosphate isomerase-like protein (cupin superfamily)
MKPLTFIFMLTRDDRTIADAVERLPQVLAAGVRHVGFKDIGVSFNTLQKLARQIRAAGAKIYLEVVSLDEASERASAEMAVSLGVDVLMGGTRPEVVLPIIAGLEIDYYPFPGTITGHPSRLEGTIGSIVNSAQRLVARKGVSGLDLLAYRFEGDVDELIGEVCRAVAPAPVIVAGSIDRRDRIEVVAKQGAAGFTVGTAALDAVFPAPSTLKDQIEWILATAAQTRKENSKMEKVNLSHSFTLFNDHWSPKIVGDVNDSQVKLAKFAGTFHWHHHEHEDELFFVVAGRLRMGFRDRNVDLEPGEFIIVQKGVEHRPEALDPECHVMLLEPRTTLNTGNVINDRTVTDLQRLA